MKVVPTNVGCKTDSDVKFGKERRKGWFSWLKRGRVSFWSQVRLSKGAEFVIIPPGSEPVALR